MARVGKSPTSWVGQQVVVEIMTEPERQEAARLNGIDDWDLTLGTAKIIP